MTSVLRCVKLVRLPHGFSDVIRAACCSHQIRQSDLPRPCYRRPRKAERQEIVSGEQVGAGNGARALAFQVERLESAVPDLWRSASGGTHDTTTD